MYDTSDADAWSAALERLPDHDIYHDVAYACAIEANGDGRPRAFVAELGDHLFVHVFVQRPIVRVGDADVDGGWSDLESVYGYSGPLATTQDTDFVARAWQAFEAWCVEERVVAEFIRFSPLLRNEALAAPGTDVVHDRDTVLLRLDVSEEELWSSYPSVQRNMVRKAERSGLLARAVSVEAGIRDFRRVYEATMERVGADRYFLLSDAYYAALLALGDRIELVEARLGDDVVAAALFLVHGSRLHYHLSGSDDRFRASAPTNLILHEAASRGRERGLGVMHLGGGLSPDRDDPLLRFKATLSAVRLPFLTGRRVHDPRMYGDLCSRWLAQAQTDVRPPYFLLYRLEVGA